MASFDFEVVIIGSGFGGSVAALRAAQKGYRRCMPSPAGRLTPGSVSITSGVWWDPVTSIEPPVWGVGSDVFAFLVTYHRHGEQHAVQEVDGSIQIRV
jgi:choline dehydrogenase-like flavoprotein